MPFAKLLLYPSELPTGISRSESNLRTIILRRLNFQFILTAVIVSSSDCPIFLGVSGKRDYNLSTYRSAINVLVGLHCFIQRDRLSDRRRCQLSVLKGPPKSSQNLPARHGVKRHGVEAV